MKTHNKPNPDIQGTKILPTYSVIITDSMTTITSEAKKIVERDFPEVGENYGWRLMSEKNLIWVFGYPNDPDGLNIPDGLFYLIFRKPLPKPKTREQIARETLEEIIKEWDVPDPEMSIFTLNQMKYALAHASDESISEFLFFYYDSDKWLEDYPDPDPEALHNLKIGEFKYSQNFEVIKVDFWDDLEYWVLNGKHTNELECGRTLVFTNFDPDESNGIDYEEFLFSYITHTGVEK